MKVCNRKGGTFYAQKSENIHKCRDGRREAREKLHAAKAALLQGGRTFVHVLRRTFATRCVEVGFEIKSLSEILGHTSPKFTLERYVHSSLELKRSNMDKLSAVGC